MTIDIRRADADFVQRYVEYQNALAKVMGQRLRRLWTRKAMVEHLVAEKIESEANDLRAMLDDCGDLPPAGDEAAMIAYAKKTAAWIERHEAEKAKHRQK